MMIMMTKTKTTMIMMIMVMQMRSLRVRALIFILHMYSIIKRLTENAIVTTVHRSSRNRVVYYNISLFTTVLVRCRNFWTSSECLL
jgi:hypothetical protein